MFDQDCIVTRKDGLPFKRFNLPPMYGDAGYSVPMGAFEQWAYVEEEWAWVEAGSAGIRADRDNGWAYQFAPGEDERDWSPFMMSKKGLDTVFPYEDTEYGVTGTVLEYRPLSAQPTVPTVGSFNDVKENDWFSKQVQWAVEQEITSGTTASTFSPKKDCTVAEILMFLYKAEGDPKFTAGQPYDNVAGSEWYAGAALWAYGVVLVSAGESQVGASCTRAQIVTFHYAALAK